MDYNAGILHYLNNNSNNNNNNNNDNNDIQMHYIHILLYSLAAISQTHPSIRDYTLVWMKAHLCLRYNRCAVTSASLVNHLKYEIEIGSYGSCLLFHNRVVCVIILVGTRHTLLTDYAAFYDYTCTLVCYVYSQE